MGGRIVSQNDKKTNKKHNADNDIYVVFAKIQTKENTTKMQKKKLKKSNKQTNI